MYINGDYVEVRCAPSATCAMYTVKTLQCSFPHLLERMYVAAIKRSRRLCSSGYGIGRWLCRVRLLAACCSLPASAPATSAVGPHTHTDTHTPFVSLLLYVSIHSSSRPTFYLHHSAVRVLFVLFLLFVYPYLSFAIHIAKASVFFTAYSISVSQ